MNVTDLPPGLRNEVRDSRQVFRTLLEAMSSPGKIVELEPLAGRPGYLSAGMSAIALTLLDYETPFWLSEKLNTPETAYYLSFHTGARLTDDLLQASFLLVDDVRSLPPLEFISSGTSEYPDQSATIILDVGSFGTGREVRLSGPGIQEYSSFSASDLDDHFWKNAQDNHTLYPLGVDFIFCAGDQVAALPRSTKIEM